jgi:hypothetical protein
LLNMGRVILGTTLRTPTITFCGQAADVHVHGDCVAENRGADFVKYLVPALCARTSIWPSDVKK